MKVGEIGVKLIFSLKKDDGSPFDLTEATEAFIHFKLKGTTWVKPCVIDKKNNIVYYEIAEDDNLQEGVLSMEVEIRFIDGSTVLKSNTITERIYPSF